MANFSDVVINGDLCTNKLISKNIIYIFSSLDLATLNSSVSVTIPSGCVGVIGSDNCIKNDSYSLQYNNNPAYQGSINIMMPFGCYAFDSAWTTIPQLEISYKGSDGTTIYYSDTAGPVFSQVVINLEKKRRIMIYPQNQMDSDILFFPGEFKIRVSRAGVVANPDTTYANTNAFVCGKIMLCKL